MYFFVICALFMGHTLAQTQDGCFCVKTRDETKFDDLTGPPGLAGEVGPPGFNGVCNHCNNTDIATLQEKIVQINETTANLQKKKSYKTMDCPIYTYNFPRDDQTIDYVQYSYVFPYLKEATFCVWVELSENDAVASIAAISSYAVGLTTNAFSIELHNGFLAVVRDSKIIATSPQRLSSIQKTHICAWFSSLSNRYALYVNGVEVTNGSSTIHPLEGKGYLILGQEQDSLGGGFDSNQASSGNITNFMGWARVLTADEINNIARKCTCPRDYTVVMTSEYTELHGEANYIIIDVCPTL